MKNYEDKMRYFRTVIDPMLEEAFKRGDEKYQGLFHNERILMRPAEDDIRHIRELHVDVRLREAEDAADMDDIDTALAKIESAIGYLTILHYRVNRKTQE